MSTCATASRDLAEPLAGTAAVAVTWLLVEQTGPWGVEALTRSHLAPDVGAALEAAADGTGVRVALIRRPGRHADRRQPAARRVFAAYTAPGAGWLRTAVVREPAVLAGLDLAALGRGEHAGFDDALGAEPYEGDPLGLVCTNGKRDRCCALLGRPLATALHAAGGTDTWEITHIGGHRFAPTLLLLPHGYAYGRMTPHGVKAAVEALRTGQVATEGCRGRSTWGRPGQAAELAVRERLGEYGADALAVVGTQGADPEWRVTVAHRDGRAWAVPVTARPATAATPASCGAQPLAQTCLTAGEPRAV